MSRRVQVKMKVEVELTGASIASVISVPGPCQGFSLDPLKGLLQLAAEFYTLATFVFMNVQCPKIRYFDH